MMDKSFLYTGLEARDKKTVEDAFEPK